MAVKYRCVDSTVIHHTKKDRHAPQSCQGGQKIWFVSERIPSDWQASGMRTRENEQHFPHPQCYFKSFTVVDFWDSF